MLLKIGTQTKFGEISAVGMREGERYYMMIDKHKTVSLIPADVIEGKNGM